MDKIRCVIHGSFAKHFDEIRRVHRIFTSAGIDVLAPEDADISHFENGFTMLAHDAPADPRMIELLYLHNLKKLGENGFSYFVDPEGYIGKSASYELGIAQVTNIRCFFSEPLADHPAYFHANSVWKPELLAEYISAHRELPSPSVKPDDAAIQKLWEELMVPGSIVSVGGIIEHEDNGRKDILLVKTYKWGGRYSVVGGKVRRNERMNDALVREIKEETGLRAWAGEHIATFDELKNSGYYLPGVQHIFVDRVIHVVSKNVQLNEEAQEYVWLSADAALRDLDIEPNARHIVQLYRDLMANPVK